MWRAHFDDQEKVILLEFMNSSGDFFIFLLTMCTITP